MMKVGNEAVKHVGVTLALASVYLGDGIGFKGVYYWNGKEITSDTIDDMYDIKREVDATPEVKAQALQFLRAKAIQRIPEILESLNEDRAKTILNGDTVRVTGGRKVKKGTEGIVFWRGDNGYGMSVGIRLSDKKDAAGRWVETAFIAPRFLEVVNPPTFSLTDAQVEEVLSHACKLDAIDRFDAFLVQNVKSILGAD